MTTKKAHCLTPPPQAVEVLTDEDVLDALQRILGYGFGRLEITIKSHFIHTIHQEYTRLGQKP